MVHLRSSPWHIPCQPYERLSIVVHYPSVSIRAAQSGLQSAPACRIQWVCHHLFRSYDRNLSNIANIRLHSVSGHTFVTAKIQKISKNAQLYYQKVVNLPFSVTAKAQTKAFTMIYKQKVVILPLFVSLKHFPKKKRGQWYLYKSDFVLLNASNDTLRSRNGIMDILFV